MKVVNWLIFIVFFAGVALCLFLTLLNSIEQRKRTRETARKSRGQCEKCGYSMEGSLSGKCPEYGNQTEFGIHISRRFKRLQARDKALRKRLPSRSEW
jgi:hypothetical protein